jgi:hypothetical protein
LRYGQRVKKATRIWQLGAFGVSPLKTAKQPENRAGKLYHRLLGTCNRFLKIVSKY